MSGLAGRQVQHGNPAVVAAAAVLSLPHAAAPHCSSNRHRPESRGPASVSRSKLSSQSARVNYRKRKAARLEDRPAGMQYCNGAYHFGVPHAFTHCPARGPYHGCQPRVPFCLCSEVLLAGLERPPAWYGGHGKQQSELSQGRWCQGSGMQAAAAVALSMPWPHLWPQGSVVIYIKP